MHLLVLQYARKKLEIQIRLSCGDICCCVKQVYKVSAFSPIIRDNSLEMRMKPLLDVTFFANLL